MDEYRNEYFSAFELGKAMALMSDMDEKSAYNYAKNRLIQYMKLKYCPDNEIEKVLSEIIPIEAK